MHEMITPPVRDAVPLQEIRGDDEQDTMLLKFMAENAVQYLRSFSWCLEVKEGYLGDGFGGIAAAFLFRVKIKGLEGYQWLWVFTGDIPPAYLLFGPYANSPYAALGKYVQGLEDWVRAAEQGQRTDHLIPIDIAPDIASLSMVRTKIAALRQNILPHMRRV